MTDLDGLSDHDTKQSGKVLPLLQRNVLPASSGSLVFGSFSSNTGYMIHMCVGLYESSYIYLTCYQLNFKHHPYTVEI